MASEGLPFSKTGGLADVIEALPRALVALGHDVAVALPRYRGTNVAAVLIPSLTVAMGGQLHFPAVDDGGVIGGGLRRISGAAESEEYGDAQSKRHTCSKQS